MRPGTACDTRAFIIPIPKYSLTSEENCAREMMSLDSFPQKYTSHILADICASVSSVVEKAYSLCLRRLRLTLQTM